jgi:hypothetical protein
MKPIKPSAIALIALSVLASNAFAVIRSPYPRKPTAPDTIIVITDNGHDSVDSSSLKVNVINEHNVDFILVRHT